MPSADGRGTECCPRWEGAGAALETDGIAVVVHGEHENAVQPQEQHVHQVFLRQTVRGQVRMHQADAPQTSRPAASARQFGDQDGRGIADDDHVHLALPIDDQTDLPSQRAGEEGEFPRLFRGVAAPHGVAPLSQTRKRLHLAGFQASRVAFQSCSYGQSLVLNRSGKKAKREGQALPFVTG